MLFIASFGGFLVTFLSSGINVALPLIGDEFHVSAVTLSWVSASYILVAAATLLPMGRVADMFGRKRMFIWGMVIFSAFSLGSAFAPSAPILLVLRALHGIGLALGSVTSVALVSLAYPAEVRGRALGICTAAIYLGLTVGPVLGGFIVHNLGWRSMFLIVGGLALVNVALPLWKLRHVEWREARTSRFDYVGSVAYGISLTAVLIGFSALPGAAGAVLIPAGIAGLALFLLWESRVADPLLNVGLLRHSRVFAFSNVATLVGYAANSAMLFLMSLYLQYNRGLNAQKAGLVLVTGTFVQVLVAPLAGRLADRAAGPLRGVHRHGCVGARPAGPQLRRRELAVLVRHHHALRARRRHSPLCHAQHHRHHGERRASAGWASRPRPSAPCARPA